MSDTTRFYWLTPPAPGAIATVCIVGRHAAESVAPLLRTASGVPLPELPLHHIALGHWALEGHGALPGRGQVPQAAEEVVLCRVDQDVLEVHCHGGQAAVRSITATLERIGCVGRPWDEWTHRAAEDLLAAEAWQALAQARTEATALLLLAQYHGALRTAVDDALRAIHGGHADQALQRIDELLRWRRLGLHLTQPWRVVLAGPANVGKSSLLNRLLGYRRAIVYDQPGTTRDVLTAQTAIDGWPVVLHDTAGLRASSDPLEEQGVARARQTLRGADLVVLVFDRTQPWTPQDSALLAEHPDALLVHNKCDRRSVEDDRPPGLLTSAWTLQGIEALLRAIASRLVPLAPDPGMAIPFTPRHVELLDEAQQALHAADAPEALRALHSLRGIHAAQRCTVPPSR